MKKIIYLFITFMIVSSSLFAQGEVEALRFSNNELFGTARAMSMGGAFGALGGDQSALASNPAGIGVYRSSEVVGTFNMSGNSAVVGDLKSKKNDFNMNNLGFVGYFPLRNDVMPHINFGFSFNKLKSFSRNVSALGNANHTLIDYIYEDYLFEKEFIEDPNDLYMVNHEEGLNAKGLDPFDSDLPWLSVFGRNAFLLQPDPNQPGNLLPLNTGGEVALTEIALQEEGYIGNYDFTVGTTLANVLNLGFALSIKGVSYSMVSDLLEDFDNGGYTLTNWVNTSGAGVNAKMGAVYRPIHELRLGLAYHTPTWYVLSETYKAEMADDLENYVTSLDYSAGKTESARFPNDFELKTPGKLVASVATVLGNRFIASLDYEVTDYSKIKLYESSGYYDDGIVEGRYTYDNEYISTDFKPTSSIRAGMEYRFSQQLSARLGYAWLENPYKKDFADMGNAVTVGSNTIFAIEGDSSYLTGGLGYRFNRNFLWIWQWCTRTVQTISILSPISMQVRHWLWMLLRLS